MNDSEITRLIDLAIDFEHKKILAKIFPTRSNVNKFISAANELNELKKSLSSD